MRPYQKMYLHLFNAVTDDDRPERAKILLIEAQQQTEAYYLDHNNSSPLKNGAY